MINPNSKEFRRKHRQTDFVERDLEIRYVAGTIKARLIIERVYLSFDSNALSSDLIKWIYDKSIALYVEDGVLMDDETFKNTLDVDDSRRKKLTVIWKKIQKALLEVTAASTVSAMKKLNQLYDARNASICVESLIQDLSKATRGDLGQIDSVKETFSFFTEHLSRKDIKVDKGDPRKCYGEFKKVFKNIQKHPELVGGVPTGIKPIDQQLIGLRDGELGVVAGPSGSGKSIFCQNALIYAWRTCGPVVGVTIEMPRLQYNMRIYCNLSGIDYEKFRRYDLTKEQWNKLDETIEKAKKIPHEFLIIDMPEGCTSSAVNSELKLAMKKNSLKLIGIDYLNIMAGNDGKVSMDWQTQLELAVSVKQLARRLNVPTWSLVQTSKDDTVAFAKHIKDQLDVGIRIEVTEETKDTGVVGMHWFKTRDFKGNSFSMQTHLDKMTFGPIETERLRQYKLLNKRKKKRLKT